MSKRLASTFTAALLLPSLALAQDSDGPRPLRPVEPAEIPQVEEAPPVQDLGGWLGEDDMQQGGADPLAPQSDVVPPGDMPPPDAAPPATETLSPEEERKQRRTVQRNYDRALDTYEDLGKPGRDLTVLDRRIANNERIVSQYSERVVEAREQRRILQVELYNRMFYLRQQRERGQIDDDTFNRLSREAERNYADRAEALKGDLQAWRVEVGQAQRRLDSLRSERRMLMASIPRSRRPRGKAEGGGEQAPPPAGMRILSQLESRLQQLDAFDTRHTMDGVDPRTVGASSVGVRRTSTPPADEGEGEDEDEDGGWFDWF